LAVFSATALDFKCEILHTYVDNVYVHTGINIIEQSKTILKLSASHYCHLVILAHSKILH